MRNILLQKAFVVAITALTGLAVGCATPVAPPIFPCYEGAQALSPGLESLVGTQLNDCSSLGRTCNSAMSIDEVCLIQGQAYPGAEQNSLCGSLAAIASFSEVIGSCQQENLHGQLCAESSDCRSDQNLVCAIDSGTEGICEPQGYQSYTRLVYVYKRQPQMTQAAFEDYWLNTHAALVSQHAATLGIHGYTQLHTSSNPLNLVLPASRGSLPPFDGAADYYIDKAVFENALQTTAGQSAMQALITDKENFVDLANSAVWLAREKVFKKELRTEPAEIMTWVGAGQSHLTDQQFRDYYSDNHGPFVAAHHDIIGLQQYIQILTLDDPLNDTLRTMHGTGAPYYAHTEQIWDFTQMFSAAAVPVMDLVAIDEGVFIEFPQSSIWLAEEVFIIPTNQ